MALNCAVLNDSLLESELFGHEKGAFTGAERRKIGRFELANGGTLLLDEAGDIPPSLQAKLLRVLQTGQFERVGGTETIQVDVRIIAASHKILEEEVKKGRFRADLFYRLNVIRIDLPPLRERTEDISLLATHFLQQQRSHGGTRVTEIASDAMQALLRHAWPGNVRELENAIRAGVALAEGSVLHRDDLPEIGRAADRPTSPRQLDDRHRPPPAGADRRADRPGRARVLHAGCSRSSRGTWRVAPATAACRAGASPRSSRSTPSSDLEFKGPRRRPAAATSPPSKPARPIRIWTPGQPRISTDCTNEKQSNHG